MKAAVLYEPNTPLKVEDVELDEPQENEILVKLAATGVCHSDLHLMKGELPHPVPFVPGHEGAGAVWEKTQGWLSSLTPADLDIIRQTTVGELNQGQMFEIYIVWHVNVHCGEIAALKGCQGAKGYPF